MAPFCWPSGLRPRSKKLADTTAEKLQSDSGSSATDIKEVESTTKTDDAKDKGKDAEKKDGDDKEKDKATSEAKDGEEKKDGDEKKDDDKKDGEEEKDKVKKVLAPVGSVSSAKNIYKSVVDDDGNWTWVDKYPEDAEEAAENEETATYAVLVRNMKSNDSRKKLEAHSIIIQSPLLKTVLAEVLADYPGVACELERLEFEAPFEPFVHRWAEFVKYMDKPDLDPKIKEHLVVLRDILVYEIGDSIKAFEDYVKNGVVTFGHLWMIFQPGAIIVSEYKGPMSAFELVETEYMANQCGKFLELRADCVDYGGKTFGRYQETIVISEFIGAKKINSLNVYPWVFHANPDKLAADLTKRGELWESLAGYHYKSYSGKAVTWDREGKEVQIQISGRIIVDTESFNRCSPYPIRYLNDWNAKDLERLSKFREHIGPDAKADNNGDDEGTVRLPPYHQMLARSRTRGYSLKLKKWLDFFVEYVEEVTWNTEAFDKLVLPADQKELIMAFSESQLEGSSFDDVISGKGKGIICLLSGPPGVGKTLTAEAVAESLKVPLHTLSSGELGSSPWEVERGLTSILELVARWNAILLLDECDVFLEARSNHDLERNKVVSIFLRTLEYYEGIMFMTTNRVENIDAAFQSRIHVSLEYPDLTSASRRQIWTNFLKGAYIKSALTDADIQELGELKLNGRQIKNVLKTAQLLASRRKSPLLERKFINTVLDVEKKRPGAPQMMAHYM